MVASFNRPIKTGRNAATDDVLYYPKNSAKRVLCPYCPKKLPEKTSKTVRSATPKVMADNRHSCRRTVWRLEHARWRQIPLGITVTAC
jgi:hypothetical protein